MWLTSPGVSEAKIKVSAGSVLIWSLACSSTLALGGRIQQDCGTEVSIPLLDVSQGPLSSVRPPGLLLTWPPLPSHSGGASTWSDCWTF